MVNYPLQAPEEKQKSWDRDSSMLFLHVRDSSVLSGLCMVNLPFAGSWEEAKVQTKVFRPWPFNAVLAGHGHLFIALGFSIKFALNQSSQFFHRKSRNKSFRSLNLSKSLQRTIHNCYSCNKQNLQYFTLLKSHWELLNKSLEKSNILSNYKLHNTLSDY